MMPARPSTRSGVLDFGACHLSARHSQPLISPIDVSLGVNIGIDTSQIYSLWTCDQGGALVEVATLTAGVEVELPHDVRALETRPVVVAHSADH